MKKTGEIFARVMEAPAVQAISRRVERGAVLSFEGVAGPAQPFMAVLLASLFPDRNIVVITDGLKSQERFEQDITTWLTVLDPADEASKKRRAPLFFPEWQTLPHDTRLPHVDVISDRLNTLIKLAAQTESAPREIVLTSVQAVQQRTLARATLASSIRTLKKGETINPLDLVEWLEDQGYEPEAQVTQKGEISLRGGILDVFPIISPWPVRLEFFGDELESLRFFDPLTQISREEIPVVTLSPAGELKLWALAQQLPESAGAAREQLTKVIRQADQCLAESRSSVWALRSPRLEEAQDFVSALAQASEQLVADKKLHLNFNVTGMPRKLSGVVEFNLLRIGVEAVTNAVKHAQAHSIDVEIRFEDRKVALRVKDDGRGFDPEHVAVARMEHQGLAGIRDRVAILGGTVSIKSQPGEHTEIVVIVPA